MNNTFEISLRMHLYINVTTNIDNEEDLGYTICDYVADSLSKENKINFSLYESIMNEDIPNELKILVTFYIPSEKNYDYKEASKVINNLLNSIPTDISILDKRINSKEELIYQYHEYLINEI